MLSLLAGGFCLLLPGAGLVDLFDSTQKDFGSVPRGSVSVHRFVLTNSTAQRIHASGVRSSCVCATPTLVSDDAEPGGTIVVEVAFNTTTFTGPRSMSIYVSFDQPHFETVTLRVNGVSRPDVVFNPGQIDFGVVEPNAAGLTKSVRIEYAGALDWRIDSVSWSERFQGTLKELYREPSRVGYELRVELAPSSESGSFTEVLRLKTNDPDTPILHVAAHATVESELSLQPAALAFDKVRRGERSARKVILRGRDPFSVEGIAGDTADLKVRSTEGTRKVHVLSVEISPEKPGIFERTVKIRTDRPDSAEAVLPIRAEVLE